MNRLVIALTLAVLLAGLGVGLAVTVPWTVLPGASPVVQVARDFTPVERAREDAFHRQLRPPAYASLLVGLLVAGALGLSPWGSRLVSSVARPFGGGWGWQVVLGTLALTLLGRLAALPLDARSEVVLRRYGLSTQDWGSWMLDAAKSVGVATVVSSLGLLAVIALARLAPRTWWAWAAAVTALLVVLASFAYPLVVEPVFNRFTPLPAGQLRSDLLALADRDGVPVRDVLVADASRRTSALNAYVSGFGRTRRIVLYDTLLAQATTPEVELVVAHELGHAKRQDVLHGTLLGALGAACAICMLALLLSWTPLLRRVGVDGPADAQVVALVLFLVAAGGLLISPAANLVSRRIEARADVHSLRLTCDVPTFIASERRLSLTNLSDLDPAPLVYALFATHPTGPERIAVARAYAARCPP